MTASKLPSMQPVTDATPIGTPVVLIDDRRVPRHTRTRSEPWALGDGTLVIKVEGIAGGYQLSRVFVAAPPVAPLDQTDLDAIRVCRDRLREIAARYEGRVGTPQWNADRDNMKAAIVAFDKILAS